MNARERLTLPVNAGIKSGATGGKADANTAAAKPAPDANPVARTSAPQRQPFDHASFIREFAFPDGRKISIHRHSVYWAAPLKDDPEHATLVAVKGGEKPLPLMIAYADFVAWWKEEAA